MNVMKLKIGLTGAVHPNMPGDDVGAYRRAVSELVELSKHYGFDLAVLPDVLQCEEDGRKAARFMDEEQVDFTLVFCASLPFGRVILPLARVQSPLGIWSIPEPTKSGVLQLNSFCGLNMLGSIVGNYLREHRITYKWFYGYPSTELFKERFLVTLKSLRAMKALAAARIGQIGGLANGFENLYVDERVLEKKFGTYIQTRHTVEEIVARAKFVEASRVHEELSAMEQEGSRVRDRVSAEAMERSVRVHLALLDFAKEHGYNALAVSCWPRFQEVYDVAVCAAMSRLNQVGIVAPCEADIPATITMLILNALGGGVSTIKDLVALDEEDGSINLWHCGVAAGCWADTSGIKWDAHFNIGSYCNGAWHGQGVVADLTLKPGQVTVFTMNNDFDNLFIMTGRVMANKKGYAGGSGWVNDLSMGGRRLSIPDLINTISVNRVNHHYPVASGDLSAELMEFAAWKGLTVLEPVPYRSYLQNGTRSILA